MPPEEWRDQSDLITGDPESRREYIKALLAVSADDGRYIMLVVAGALAVVTLFLKDIPIEDIQAEPTWVGVLMGIGLTSLVASGAAFFTYAGAVNRVRMSIARCLASADALTARDLWAGPRGVWSTNRWRYMLGTVLLFVGGLSEAIVLAVIFS